MTGSWPGAIIGRFEPAYRCLTGRGRMPYVRLAVASMLAVTAAAACGGNPVPSLVANAFPDGPQAASDIDGRFRLDFALPKRTFTAAEAIEGIATLSVLGPGIGKVGASGGGPIVFGIREVGGRREIGPASQADCQSFPIGQGSPLSSGITKSGGFSADDPDAGFYVDFFEDPEVHLPPGTWEITAYASFAEGDCSARALELSVPIRIEVAPGS